jgi:hypothetical protein
MSSDVGTRRCGNKRLYKACECTLHSTVCLYSFVAMHACLRLTLWTIALAVTGLVWSRFSLTIIPKNYSLFAVNFLLGAVGSIQVGRAVKYQYIEAGSAAGLEANP